MAADPIKTKERRAANRDIAVNRRAYHDYFIDETYEAGIVLSGTEIKSVREGRVNLTDGFCRIDKRELFLVNAHITPYESAGKYFNHVATRSRKLLLHKSEILKLSIQTQAKGLTLIPLKMYMKDGKAKVLVAIARGKKLYDKRDALAEQDAKREIARALRDRERE